MKIRLLVEAEAEAEAAALWYENRKEGLGFDFLDALAHGLESVEQHPQSFARTESLQGTREVRRYLLARFPFAIVYEVRADEILVLAIAHARRRPGYWKRRRG
jgi:toxin ParE1/3/4